MTEFDTGEQEREPTPRSDAASTGGGRGRRVALTLIAVVALAGFTTLVVYSYKRSNTPAVVTEPPVIAAKEGPTKIRPKEPGGMEIPDRDKQVFSRINPAENPPQIEHLLPPPETAVARPPAAPAAPAVKNPETAGQLASRAPAGDTEKLIAPPKSETMPKPTPPAAKPTASSSSRPEAPKASSVASRPPSAPPTATSQATTDAKKSVVERIVVPVPPPSAKPGKVPERLSLLPEPAARGWRVQIAAFRSADATKRSWRKLSSRHKDLLGGLKLTVVRADLGKKGVFYRMQAGPLADANAARKLCAEIKKRKLGCLIVRP